MDGMTIDYELQKDCTLKIYLSEDAKKRLKHKFWEFLGVYNAMAVWFDSPTADEQQKITYFKQLQNMLESMNHMLNLVLLAGITKEEVIKEFNMPF